MGRRGLQVALTGIGTVATLFGALGVATGVRGVRGAPPAAVSPNVDSEMRFFAAWYAAAGVLLLRAARQPEAERAVIDVVSAAALTGALGRVIGVRTSGRPDPLFLGLLGVEAVIGATLPPWQRAVARAGA